MVSCSFPISDDFNRVILSMRRGQEFTDYINASFIDVSTFNYPMHSLLLLPLTHFWTCVAEEMCFAVTQGYRQKDYFIATQGPLTHTVEDFWRMVWEWKCHSIVMLTELQEREQVSCDSCRQAKINGYITTTAVQHKPSVFPFPASFTKL